MSPEGLLDSLSALLDVAGLRSEVLPGAEPVFDGSLLRLRTLHSDVMLLDVLSVDGVGFLHDLAFLLSLSHHGHHIVVLVLAPLRKGLLAAESGPDSHRLPSRVLLSALQVLVSGEHVQHLECFLQCTLAQGVRQDRAAALSSQGVLLPSVEHSVLLGREEVILIGCCQVDDHVFILALLFC